MADLAHPIQAQPRAPTKQSTARLEHSPGVASSTLGEGDLAELVGTGQNQNGRSSTRQSVEVPGRLRSFEGSSGTQRPLKQAARRPSTRGNFGAIAEDYQTLDHKENEVL